MLLIVWVAIVAFFRLVGALWAFHAISWDTFFVVATIALAGIYVGSRR